MRSQNRNKEAVLSPENTNRDEKKFSSYAIKLIRRLLPIADTDCTGITIQDRQWLEDVLKRLRKQGRIAVATLDFLND